MKDDQHHKPATEQAEEFDIELQTWYKLQAKEEPSRELDETIIKMAKESSAVSNKVSTENSQHKAQLTGDKRADNVVRVDKSFWRNNRWALSSAASVMLVVTVIMLNPHSSQISLSDDIPMMMEMIEPRLADAVDDDIFEASHSANMKSESLGSDYSASFEASNSDSMKSESLGSGVSDGARFEGNIEGNKSANMKSALRQAPRAQSAAMPASAPKFTGADEAKMKQAGEVYRTEYRNGHGTEHSAKLGAEAPSKLTLPNKTSDEQTSSSHASSNDVSSNYASPNQASLKSALSSNGLPNKSVPQREAVVSAKQALNHLQHLIDSKQWAEAEKLATKIAKQYPRLKEVEHPQHQRWNEFKAEIIEH
ncbi:hypothetical protein [Shewanella violacea]|uniref:Uncharacterized protein n=2 Tax=Shewanella violacea TaxID=60217 RepID=D4ZAS1_SHEVD|nr:hypothetical protein [Shewanella violacea]BAG66044.1 putative uncharacterized protein [Shewanella violacea]BAJ03116.1 hypothetical protein SVI_3145 [Shewanella violacea DSS12]